MEGMRPVGTALSFAIDIKCEDVKLMIPSFQLSEGLRIKVRHQYCLIVNPVVREYA